MSNFSFRMSDEVKNFFVACQMASEDSPFDKLKSSNSLTRESGSSYNMKTLPIVLSEKRKEILVRRKFIPSSRITNSIRLGTNLGPSLTSQLNKERCVITSNPIEFVSNLDIILTFGDHDKVTPHELCQISYTTDVLGSLINITNQESRLLNSPIFEYLNFKFPDNKLVNPTFVQKPLSTVLRNPIFQSTGLSCYPNNRKLISKITENKRFYWTVCKNTKICSIHATQTGKCLYFRKGNCVLHDFQHIGLLAIESKYSIGRLNFVFFTSTICANTGESKIQRISTINVKLTGQIQNKERDFVVYFRSSNTFCIKYKSHDEFRYKIE